MDAQQFRESGLSQLRLRARQIDGNKIAIDLIYVCDANSSHDPEVIEIDSIRVMVESDGDEVTLEGW